MGTAASSSVTGSAHSPRERILRAAQELFFTQGIHATGVAALVGAARVSSRTFYKQFSTKNALVEEYLRRFELDRSLANEAALERIDLTARERLLAIFAPPASGTQTPQRGCPFHNAAVEGAGDLPRIANLARLHKRTFRDRLVATAAAAGASDPEGLGRQLAVLFEGANALATSTDDAEAFADARRAAASLLESALAAASSR